MKTSELQSALGPALFAAKGKFPKIAKNKKGQAGNRAFNYAPLDVILDACDPILRECGLMVTQGTEGHELVTRLEHAESGQWRETRMPINAEHANMQSYGIEVTYRRRYSVQLILGIVTEEDVDIKEKERKKGADFTKDEEGHRVSATAEAFKLLQPEEQSRVGKIADRIKAAPSASRMLDVLNAEDLDQDQKAGLWYLLDSKTRSAIKAAQKEAA